MKASIIKRISQACTGMLFQVLLLSFLGLFFFKRNDVALFFGYDGAHCRELTRYNFEWCNILSSTSLCPLWGMGDIKFGMNFWLSIPAVLSYFLSGPVPNPVYIYTLTTVELFLAIWFLSRSLGCNRFVIILSAWAGSIFPMPFIVPVARGFAGFYAISGLIPYIMEQMAIATFVIAAVCKLRRDDLRINLWIGIGAVALVYLLVFQFPTQFVLVVPILAACSIYAAVTLIRKRSDFIRAGAVFACLSALLVCPAIFILSMILWAVPSFFYSELLNTNAGHPTWEFVTMAAHGVMGTGWMNTIVYGFAGAGALGSLFSKSEIRRRVAILYLGLAAIVFGFGIFVTFALKSYGGILSLYFEWTLWPVMFVFAALFIFDGLRITISWLGSNGENWNFARFSSSDKGLVLCSILIPLGFWGLISGQSDLRLANDFPKPPAKTPLVDLFEKQLALSPGDAWKGSVANFCAIRFQNGAINWMSQSFYDRHLSFATGNDHRGPGLWWYNIPTLFSYHQCMSPAFYFLVTRLFSNSADVQSRNVVVLTKPKPKLLGLFGVRYFLSDLPANLDAAASPVGVFSWQPRGMPTALPLYVYEVKNPNLVGFSPTQVLRVDSGNDGITKMEAADFDPQLQVVLHEDVSVQLSRCTESSLRWSKNGAEVSASSEGWSLLVLPITYSNCLRLLPCDVGPSEPNEAKLIRVNVGMTGVLFNGKLQSTIVQRFGPYTNVFGRLKDYREFKYLMRNSDS